MKRTANSLFSGLVRLLTVLTVLVLAFVIYFIVHEALPLFGEVSVREFLLGRRWMPVDYTGAGAGFGIFNFIAGTVAVSLLGMLISAAVGLGAAVWLACEASGRLCRVLYAVIDLLAGVPSVIFGLVGLTVLVPIFLKAGVHTGSCVLCAAIVLAVMLLPYLVSSCADTIRKAAERYLAAAELLGVERWYAIATVVLPVSFRSLLTSMILAIGRAMGETMAVMMVIGCANLFPSVLGKGESIAALIALEMGSAQVGSTHYHALYAAGLVLMLLLFAINVGIRALQNYLQREGGL